MAKIALPRNLNIDTLGIVHMRCAQAASTGDKILWLDFSSLHFIDPIGITSLACLASGYADAGIEVGFLEVDSNTPAVTYLNSTGFFEVLSDGEFQKSTARGTTIEFTAIRGTQHVMFLHGKLCPWIAREVHLSSDTIESLSACLAEVLQNVEHHGGQLGFAVAQHYPKRHELRISVSDRGVGIPVHVRKVLPDLNDPAALVQSCKRGFTTKKNFTNRGYGLDNLLRYVVGNNGGTVTLRSRKGILIARQQMNRTFLNSEMANWDCPGTAVQIVLRTDTLEKSDEAVRPEVFEWF